MKKLIAVMLCIVLCVGMIVPAMAEGNTFSFSLDHNTLPVSSSEQTVVLTFQGTPYGVSGVQYAVIYPEGWTPTFVGSDLSNPDPHLSTFYYDEGRPCFMVLWYDEQGITHPGVSNFGSISFKIPANTEGTFNFVISDISVYLDANTPLYDPGTELTVPLTITGGSVASPYTVSIVRADGSTDPVNPDNEFDMNVVVSGAAYAGLQATVTYDSALFDYVSADTTATVTPGTGSVELYLNDVNNTKPDGSVAATLTFKAKAPTSGDSASGDFDFSYAKACGVDSALDGTGPSTIGEKVTVTVVNQFTVRFTDKDDQLIEGAEYLVNAGSYLTEVPDAPAVDYYDFAGWNDGTTTYATADAVKAVAITKDATFKATYEAKTYNVTLQSGLTGAEKATYDTNYTVTIADYDSDYIYTVNYTVAGGEEQTATDNGNGTFTIPGANITGVLNVTLTKKRNATVSVHENYVTGYTLVTVASTGSKAYSYDGNAMYFVSEKNEYAWLVEGAVTQETAAGKVGETAAAAGTVTISVDVNGDGTVDIDDAVVVNAVLNKRYPVQTNMAVYLRANVDTYGEYKINAADINAIITDTYYEK